MIRNNRRIAEIIGIRPSMIYKIRRGDRYPGLKTMMKIEEVTKWSLNEQIEARVAGTYSQRFVEVLSASFESKN